LLTCKCVSTDRNDQNVVGGPDRFAVGMLERFQPKVEVWKLPFSKAADKMHEDYCTHTGILLGPTQWRRKDTGSSRRAVA
jgi:hypothetical protein